MKFLLFFLLLLIVSSCNEKDYELKNKLSIIFTGNINAEIEPCGCRQFPLGGMDNVYGALESERAQSSVIFIDAGDTFYQASFIPDGEEDSSFKKANAVKEGLNLLKLNYKVLGDQDLSGGEKNLEKLINKSHFKILGSNISSSLKIDYVKYDKIDFFNHKIFLFGITNPETIQPQYRKHFQPIEDSISRVIKELEQKEGFDKKNPYHKLILISHSGEKVEQKLAKKFPNLDWILGSHSMNFTQKPVMHGSTSLAQMLSRNHYIGKIEFNKDQEKETYSVIEINQALAKNVKENPLTTFLKEQKSIIDLAQSKEQDSQYEQFYESNRIPTATTCMDCHDAQGTFWQKTPHSLAYMTLKKSNKNHDLDCLKCHSLGNKNTKGYVNSNQIVLVDKPDDYWKEVFSKSLHKGKVRDLKPETILTHSKAWYYTDLKYNVDYNYANVQCLNCHDQNETHLNQPSLGKKLNPEKIKNACLKCHTPDQSTHWYQGQKLIQETFQKAYKKVSCPKSLE